MVYLKDEQYYTDLYDLLTIKECLEWEKNIQEKDLSISRRTAAGPRYLGRSIQQGENSLREVLFRKNANGDIFSDGSPGKRKGD